MTTELVAKPDGLPALSFSREQVDLIKRTVAKGTTDDELALFLYTCKRTGLDPLVRQIYAVKRQTKNGELMTIQTGIDGYRLIAERTGNYAPGQEPAYVHEGGALVSATAYVKKKTADGEWHVIAATAFYGEYVPKDKEGKPFPMWVKMPHVMLAKCAEALALRRAFPAEIAGVYSTEEMAQEEIIETEAKPELRPPTRKAQEKPQENAENAENSSITITFIPKSAGSKLDSKGNSRYWVKLPSGEFAGTYHEEDGEAILKAKDQEVPITITTEIRGDYINITKAEIKEG